MLPNRSSVYTLGAAPFMAIQKWRGSTYHDHRRRTQFHNQRVKHHNRLHQLNYR